MTVQHYADHPQKRNPDEIRQAKGKEASQPEGQAKDSHPRDAHTQAEQASRSVMHPENYDPEWRYYHGAWGG